MVKYKIPRGLKKRTSTITCKSIYNPKEKASMDTRDVLQCNINLVDEPNWDKYKQNHKETDVTRVAPFQIEVETSLDDTKKPFAVQVKQLCSTENVVCENVTPNGYITKFTEIIVPLLGKASISSPSSSMTPPPLSPPSGVKGLIPPSTIKGLTPPSGGLSPPPPPSSSFGKPPTAPPSGVKIQGGTSADELGSLKLSSVQKEPEKPREKTPEEIEQEKEMQRKAMLSKLNADIAGSGISLIKDKDTCLAAGESLASKYNNEAFTHYVEIPDSEYYSIGTYKGFDEKRCNLLNTNKQLIGTQYGFKFKLNPFERKVENKQTCQVLYDNEPITKANAEILQQKIDELTEKGKFPQYVYGGNLDIKKVNVSGLKSCIPVHKLFGQLSSSLPFEVCQLLDVDKDYKKKLKDSGFELQLNEKYQTCDTQPIKKEKKDAKS